ncbi:hypothetical protein SCOCK_140082 [Actinacidiphila cocklensis]|uniref:Uncharacterized protein n=1 Tax=Actinacidiphila cocklensis TaxID=887465 RepID=A0A9W4DKK1_9ACTN|nr:hypothetical protein SCOCK_140082 [Actinacidiphila cocklensis]
MGSSDSNAPTVIAANPRAATLRRISTLPHPFGPTPETQSANLSDPPNPRASPPGSPAGRPAAGHRHAWRPSADRGETSTGPPATTVPGRR